jgi:prolyl oligopeptidase
MFGRVIHGRKWLVLVGAQLASANRGLARGSLFGPAPRLLSASAAGGRRAPAPRWASKAAIGLGFAAAASAASSEQALTPAGRVAFWEARQGEHAWLEEVLGDKALAWVRGHNEKTLASLGDPTGSPMYERVLNILTSKDKIPYVNKVGELYYNFWQDKDNKRGLLRRTTLKSYEAGAGANAEAVEWETVLSIDALCEAEGESWVYKGNTLLDEGEGVAPTRTLVYLSRGGADATVVREFDLQTLKFVPAAEGGFELAEAKSNVDWQSRDVLLVGTDFGPGSLTDSGYPRTVHEWRRGTPLSASAQVYEGEATDVSVRSYTSRHCE